MKENWDSRGKFFFELDVILLRLMDSGKFQQKKVWDH